MSRLPDYFLLHESARIMRAMLKDMDRKSEAAIEAKLHLKDINRGIIRECDKVLPKLQKLAAAEGYRGRRGATHRARARQVATIKAEAEGRLSCAQ